ncbi:MAG: hypothetical protein EPN97_08785 [Alphaproteobacteria bacterium]|nr:MAG: hypothetical protein EPN97_08785 [Alphaproteobacteria bacterium]
MNTARSIRNGLHVDPDGARYWYSNDLLHREHGPAVEWPDGSREWWLYGALHRDGGPAIERADGSREWWEHGRQIPGGDLNGETRCR